VYVDASALAKLFLPEAESDALNRSLEGRRDLILSDLALTETVSSLCRRRREGSVGSEVVVTVQQAILERLESGQFRRIEVDSTTHREAERLLIMLATPLRAADALHLALAIQAEARTVLTYDRRLADATRAAGLEARP